ncbi:3309_t:CDS:2 [Cetraspora pellucida]|uniref:3309_t:CDS:1 n=1 Tax=Cetraspora pellucida TaxID=1433469 RepID=A0ACA9N1W3_9GLOM|nr:3309_t:CDS:2 [Cetraspora pellucida]
MLANKKSLKKFLAKKKAKGGCSHDEFWIWFVKGNKNETSKGYYFAMCSFCDHYWVNAKLSKLKTHLAYKCQKVDSDTRIKVLVLLTNDESDNDMASTSTATNQINKILLKMIVCCNLPFALVEHSFFQEYTKALHATYSIPSHWVLSNTLLDQELA